jgi:hypothetical protein
MGTFFMDSGISPDTGNSDLSSPQGNEGEIEVPLHMLAIDGKDPAVGDTCDFSIEARVTRVEGDSAYVTPEKVNGQEVEQDAESASEDGSEPSFSDSGGYQQP